MLIYLMGQVGQTERNTHRSIRILREDGKQKELLPRDRPNLLTCRTEAVRLKGEHNTNSYLFPNLSSMKQFHNVLSYTTSILRYH